MGFKVRVRGGAEWDGTKPCLNYKRLAKDASAGGHLKVR